MQKRIQLPSGRMIEVPNDVTPQEELEIVTAEDAKDKPPSPSTAIPSLTDRASAFGRAMAPGLFDPVMSTVSGIKDVVTNPENRSTMGAMAGGIAGTKAGAGLSALFPPAAPIAVPAGMLLGTVLGGFAGSMTEGKDAGVAMQEGADEGLWSLVGGPLPKMAATPVRKAARGLTGLALNPSDDIINAMRQGADGKPLPALKERQREFRRRAESLMDRGVPGVPGGATFAKGADDLWKGFRAGKVDLVKSNPNPISRTGLLSPTAFDDMMAQVARQRGGASAEKAGSAIDTAVDEWLSTATPMTNVRKAAPGGRPEVMAAAPQQSWSHFDVDQRLQGLQDVLDDMPSKAPGPMRRQHPDFDEQALEILRRELSATSKAQPVVGPDGRMVADYDKEISNLLPMSQAAYDVPENIMGPPRIRIAGQGGAPSFQAFEYAKAPAGMIAKGLHSTAKGLNATSKYGPKMSQLVRMLMAPSHEPKR